MTGGSNNQLERVKERSFISDTTQLLVVAAAVLAAAAEAAADFVLFDVEVSKMMLVIINTLYASKEIFALELI